MRVCLPVTCDLCVTEIRQKLAAAELQPARASVDAFFGSAKHTRARTALTGRFTAGKYAQVKVNTRSLVQHRWEEDLVGGAARATRSPGYSRAQ